MRRALVVGYGSIGARHASVLKNLDYEVALVTNRLISDFTVFTNIEHAVNVYSPDYVVISNETHRHWNSLEELMLSGYENKILVEKPLFEDFKSRVKFNTELIRVGFNLRFHPLIQRLRNLINGKEILSVNTYAGQYLPHWRKTSYSECYSAQRSLGGGVLRDLSHEIDYSTWLFGRCLRLLAVGGKFSSLAIDSDDIYVMLMQSELCPIINIHLTYLDRTPKRRILVNTNKETIEIDLVDNFIEIDGHREYAEKDIAATYEEMHRAFLSDDMSCMCTFTEGLDVVKTIKNAEFSNNNARWID
jgi:predicted dehydrogenase